MIRGKLLWVVKVRVQACVQRNVGMIQYPMDLLAPKAGPVTVTDLSWLYQGFWFSAQLRRKFTLGTDCSPTAWL